MNQRKCRMFSVLNEEQPALWPHLPLRPLLAVRLVWDVSIKIAECKCLEALPYINRSVLKKRVACIGTVQNEGDWAQPNKHFATQNSICIDECPACHLATALKMAQKNRGPYSGTSVSLAFLSPSAVASITTSSFSFIELKSTSMCFLQLFSPRWPSV